MTVERINLDNRRVVYINNPCCPPYAMSAKLKVGVLVVLVIASSAAFAASANTSADIDRSASVDVVDDSNGLLSLEPDTTDGVVSQNSTGALSVDFAQGNATGVNTASTFEVGDQANPTTSYAFNITNQDDESRTLDLAYALTNSESDSDENIQFKVYNSTGSPLVTASEETDVSTTLSSGQTAYVVIVVDTHGLGSGDDLTGTLTLTV